MRFSVYRYNPDKHSRPFMQNFDLELQHDDRMLLDAILRLKAQDPSLSLRRSCREGVCGSDAMNINGRNGLACITRLPGQRRTTARQGTAAITGRATNSTGSTNASCALAAAHNARRSGGTRTSLSGRPVCCKPTASSSTAATAQHPNGSTIWMTRIGCFDAAPS